MNFQTRIRTPEGVVFDGVTEGLILPGAGGLFGIQAAHEPMLAVLAPGIVTLFQTGDRLHMAVGGGVVEVAAAGVTVLTEMAAIADTESEAEERLEAYQKQAMVALPSAVEFT